MIISAVITILPSAAGWSSRVRSQEIEYRLRRTFSDDDKIESAFGSRRTYALMVMLANVINWTQNRTPNVKVDWADDPYAYDQVVRGINAVLEHFRPSGPVPQTAQEIADAGGSRQGVGAAVHILGEVQVADPALALMGSTLRQHKMKHLKTDLGALADRPRLFGKSGENTRAHDKLGREFGALVRKSRRDPNGLNLSEWRRLHEIAQIRDNEGNSQ
jgi:hypothetical protein